MNRGEFVLIYPEQEMWFNYRKPRPPKRGAYYYAAKLNVPVISCFVKIINIDKRKSSEFCDVRHELYVLDPLIPDPSLSVRQNSLAMAEQDYRQKVEAYEKPTAKSWITLLIRPISAVGSWRNRKNNGFMTIHPPSYFMKAWRV